QQRIGLQPHRHWTALPFDALHATGEPPHGDNHWAPALWPGHMYEHLRRRVRNTERRHERPAAHRAPNAAGMSSPDIANPKGYKHRGHKSQRDWTGTVCRCVALATLPDRLLLHWPTSKLANARRHGVPPTRWFQNRHRLSHID